jgi:hypothetical protein
MPHFWPVLQEMGSRSEDRGRKDSGRKVMENVPKIVTQRLGAQAIAVDHPEAELLTAFAERSLSEKERSRVLEHLARCRDCREVVALALPADQPVIEVVRPGRASWLTWPRLRWALVAAGVMVVGSFGLLHYRNTSNASMVALYKPSSGDVAEAKKLPAAPSESMAKVETQKKLETQKTEPAAPPLTAKAKPNADIHKEFVRLDQYSKLENVPISRLSDPAWPEVTDAVAAEHGCGRQLRCISIPGSRARRGPIAGAAAIRQSDDRDNYRTGSVLNGWHYRRTAQAEREPRYSCGAEAVDWIPG